jgi:hypothetical protein
MSKKYELTSECKIVAGVKLFRIRALKAIARFSVEIGDLGGWIEKEGNLNQSGNAWVYCDARVYGNAEVSGNAWVYGDAEVSGNADYMVFKNSWSSGRYFTYTRSNKMWKVSCFYGTGEKLIKKAYADSELSGRCYEAVVKAVEQIEAAKAELMKKNQKLTRR